MRVYEYRDDPKRLPRARELGPSHALTSPGAIDAIARHFRLERAVMVHPQTYVVTANDGALRCGGPVEEHVHVGTSAVVYPAATIPEIAFEHGATLCEFNLESTGLTHTGRVRHFVEGSAGKTLARLVERLVADLAEAKE